MNVLTQLEFEEKLKLLNIEGEMEILMYTKASGPIQYRCLRCNRVYNKTRASHMYENKTFCFSCYKLKKDESTIKHKAKNKYEKQKQLIWLNQDEYLTTPVNGNMIMFCQKCKRTFSISFSNFVQQINLCSHCYDKTVSRKLPIEEARRRVKEVFGDEYEIIQYDRGVSKPCLIKHNCGFIFKRSVNNLLISKGCPKCNKTYSRGELRLIQLFNKYNINYEYQVFFPELGRKSFDFRASFNSQQILIEYQGAQHYEATNWFGGNDKFAKQRENDFIKLQFCVKEKLPLIIIPYWHYSNIEKIILYLIEGSTTKCSSELTGVKIYNLEDIVCS